ncbi:photosynthetic complex putative assembly protein PuhB [Altererythrobacter sp. GH1-8]|uniref:photosynthetic complex putative assembly protein PuhB n=1 Tax=Altererythrobacter sp. GH1-8 TaxID=3349333 RepID=UPI00374CD569
MMEYDFEPIRGLPEDLPADEYVVWQGAPDWRLFARTALYTRWVAGYFLALGAFALVSGSIGGAIATGLAGVAAIGLLALFAVLVAKTTVYTITNKRIVFRIGIALNKCINLPLKVIGAADLRAHGAGFGDIAVSLTAAHRLGYAVFWPHVRPFHFREPQPMLRALLEAEQVARLLAQSCATVAPHQAGEVLRDRGSSASPDGLTEAHV